MNSTATPEFDLEVQHGPHTARYECPHAHPAGGLWPSFSLRSNPRARRLRSFGVNALRTLVLKLFLAAASGTSAFADGTKGTIDEVFELRKTTQETESILAVYEDGTVNHIYRGFSKKSKVQSYSIYRHIPLAEVATLLRRLREAGIERIKPGTRYNPEYPKLSVSWDWIRRGQRPPLQDRPLPKETQPAITAIVAELFKQLDVEKPTPKDFTPRPPE